MLANTKILIQKLDALNQQRINRALVSMDHSGKAVFQLIPLLFHFNHPAIPGYYDNSVPYGIANFDCSSILQWFATQANLNTSEISLIAEHPYPAILGLYSMGSTATIGQSFSSDMDIWVCISSTMSNDEREHLTRKSLLITEWAKSQGVEANFFLMDELRFKHNRSEAMTGDNCGSSQHLLLLDEFYRSAVRLAGCRLIWQLVPPEMEEHYDDYVFTLCKCEHFDCSQWIDFGPLHHIPAEEYFGSNLWHLYKSIDSPYKSVLKAILLEAYSWEYPNTQLLSLETKRRFFTDHANEHDMDSYTLMLEKVTQYLKSIGDNIRLELVRRCFYLKTHEKLSNSAVHTTPTTWRTEILTNLVKQWCWNDDTLNELNNRRHWKVEQVKIVHQALLSALMLSYRNLIQFARRNEITSAISPQDISILARKLYAAFEELPGKVTLLNPQISPNLCEPDLSFIQVPNGHTNAAGWYLYKQPLIAKRMIGQKALLHHEYLSKLVAWSFFNGLITESTRVHSVVRDAHLDIDKLYQMVSDLRNTFSLHKRRPSMQALASPCEISQLALFINFEHDPTMALDSRSVKIHSKQANILSFEDNLCLIGSVDFVYRNSWHEVRTLHFTGETAMLDALKTILSKMHQDAVAPESVDVFCYSEYMRTMIRNQVYQLLTECIELRLKPLEQEIRRRFKALRLGSKMYGLFFERRGVSVQKLENPIDFYRSISVNKLQSSSLQIQNNNGQHQLPAVIDSFASEGLIQFFFEDFEQSFNIYVLDEANKMEVYLQFTGEKDDIIANVNRFYTMAENNTTSDNRVPSTPFLINFNLPQYYQIVHPENGAAYVVPYRNDHSVNTYLCHAATA